jgi:hypothetical protein
VKEEGMRLRIRAFGLAFGIVVGLGFFVVTLYSLAFGTGASLALFGHMFIAGFSRSVIGAFVGLIWGFVYGFIAGALVAWFYNLFHKVLYKSAAAN